MPEVKEIMFDDDTFTDFNAARRRDRPRPGQARRDLVLQRQGERALQDAEGHEGKRPAPAAGRLRVGRRPDPAQHQEGPAHRHRAALHRRLPQARHPDSRHLHSRPAGRDRRRRSRRPSSIAKEINPHTIQVSLAAPYPGTTLYKQAVENGWLQENDAVNLVNEQGVQLARDQLSASVAAKRSTTAWKCSTSASISGRARSGRSSAEMLTSWEMMKRRLREGVEFFRFLRAREA